MQRQKARDQEKSWNTSPDPDLHIDFMTVADLKEVMAIEKASFRSPWPQSYFVQEIESNPISIATVLRFQQTGNARAGQVIGFCVAWVIDRLFHINNLAVDPAFRQRGYGKILMESMMELAKQNRCDRVYLEVRVSNEPAIQLYRSLGFRPMERLARYYDDTLEDAFVYGRQL